MRSALPICKQCGQPIIGDYVNALGATWHPEHFVCAGCGRPLESTRFVMHDEAPYHTACYGQYVAPRCAYCGKPLITEYLVDQWGTTHCKEHQGQYPSCSFCGRLVPPEQQDGSTEYIRCPICRASAIESAVEAKPHFSQVIRWVSDQGLAYNNLHLSLELCHRTRLAELLQVRSHTHSLGATTSSIYEQNGQVVRAQVNGIAVLHGLPAMLFKGVTIHELGHVWLIVQSIRGLPTWAEEGFCEFLSYHYYDEVNTAESCYHALGIERNSDPVYGEGFRRIQAFVERYGFARYLEILCTTKQLPRW